MLKSSTLSLRKMLAFLNKDLKTFVSYKLSFLMTFGGVLVSVTTFYYIGKLFGKSVDRYLVSYNTDYFSFVLVGIAFTTYLSTSLRTFSGRIREAQSTGVLEAMLVTPSSTSEVITGMSLWDFTFASLRIVAYLFLGFLFFGMRFNNPNILAGFLILLLTIICFSSIGIMSAGFILVFKRSEPIGWFIGSVSGLFGGVYFPIEVLHPKLQVISKVIPVTYSLRGLRHALLAGHTFSALMPDILVLCGFCFILVPLAIWVFKQGLKHVKIDGSLVYY